MKNTDTSIPLPKAFIKFGKLEYMAKYIDKGDLRFSPACEFSLMQEGRDKVADKCEGSSYYSISNLCISPLHSDNENGIEYGKPILIAEEAQLRSTTQTIQQIPIHCLYSYSKPPINAVVKLDNYEQIVREFPDYDAAVIIYNPPEFLHKLREKYEIYENYVTYSDRTPLEYEEVNDIHRLYYKREEFKEQHEFRIALSKLQIEKPKIYRIGSLLGIAYCVPLKCLKHGIIIADNDADFQFLKKRYEELGVEIGDAVHFFDVRRS